MRQRGGAACGRIWRQSESKVAMVARILVVTVPLEFSRLP